MKHESCVRCCVGADYVTCCRSWKSLAYSVLLLWNRKHCNGWWWHLQSVVNMRCSWLLAIYPANWCERRTFTPLFVIWWQLAVVQEETCARDCEWGEKETWAGGAVRVAFHSPWILCCAEGFCLCQCVCLSTAFLLLDTNIVWKEAASLAVFLGYILDKRWLGLKYTLLDEFQRITQCV